MLSKTGLKITPPPKPKVPAIHPPIRETAINLLLMFHEYLRSLLQIPLLYLILNYYSYCTLLIAFYVKIKHTTTNSRHRPKSYH
jgi:hypothetical protein